MTRGPPGPHSPCKPTNTAAASSGDATGRWGGSGKPDLSSASEGSAGPTGRPGAGQTGSALSCNKHHTRDRAVQHSPLAVYAREIKTDVHTKRARTCSRPLYLQEAKPGSDPTHPAGDDPRSETQRTAGGRDAVGGPRGHQSEWRQPVPKVPSSRIPFK